MKKITFLFIFSFVNFLFGQSKMPLIRSNAKAISINDGGVLSKNSWTLTPSAKPDIYTADRTRKAKWVTFYTDIDSIRVKIKPGESYDFVVLWNGKDSCFTRISSAIPPEVKGNHKAKNKRDTIPFVLESNNAIHVKAIVNQQDTLNLHLDLGSFDIKITQDALLKRTHLLANQPDALLGKAKPNFNNLVEVKTVQMGKLIFKNPIVEATGLTATGMDGRFAWSLFEGRVLEIDYDQKWIVIYDKLPKKKLKGYKEVELTFPESFPCVKMAIELDNIQYSGSFLLDTGADKAMLLDSNWVYKQHFKSQMPLIKTNVLRNPRGVKFETKVVKCPKILLANSILKDVPVSLLGSQNPANFEINFLGNDVLKRFNTVLDLKNDRIYFKPNSLINLPYKEAS